MGFGNDSDARTRAANKTISDIRIASRELCEAVGKWRADRSTRNEEAMIRAHDNYKKAKVDALTRAGSNGW